MQQIEMREQTEMTERELCAELREVWKVVWRRRWFVRRESQRVWSRRHLLTMM